MRSVLVSLPSGAGVVRLEDGSVIVTSEVGGDRGAELRDGDRFHPVKFAVDEDRCVVGGLLPPGAVSAEAVDDRGTRVPAAVAEGAYVAVLEQPDDPRDPIVCCRDAAGVPVRRPWAAEYPVVRVTDAKEACPACGANDFDEYQPFEDWRGGQVRPDGRTVPAPVVSCRVCGHEEEEGMFISAPAQPAGPASQLSRAELMARANAMRREHMWRAVAPGLQAQRFPIYAVESWPTQLSGCGSEDDGRLTYVTIRHCFTEDTDPAGSERPRLVITTKLGDPRDSGPLGEARQALQGWVHTERPPGRSPDASHAATTLWLDARRRERRAAVLGAVQSEQAILIDGAHTPALMLTALSGDWAAVAVRGDLTIIIAGHDPQPDSLRLAPIADPAERFAPQPLGTY